MQVLLASLADGDIEHSRLVNTAWRKVLSAFVRGLVLHLGSNVEAVASFVELYTASFPHWERLHLTVGRSSYATATGLRLSHLLQRTELLQRLRHLSISLRRVCHLDLPTLVCLRCLQSISIYGVGQYQGSPGAYTLRHLHRTHASLGHSAAVASAACAL